MCAACVQRVCSVCVCTFRSSLREEACTTVWHALCYAARLPLEPEEEAREQIAEHQWRQGAGDGDGDTAQPDELEHVEVDVEAGREHKQH